MEVATATPVEIVSTPDGDPLAGTSYFLWTMRACVYGLLAIAYWQGGPLVQLAALAAGFFAIWGDRAGALRHLLNLVGLAVALALWPLVGVFLGRWFTLAFGLPAATAMVLAALLLIIVARIITAIIGRRLSRTLTSHRYLYVLNRTGGSLLGVAEGGLLVCFLVWALTLLGPSIYLYSVALEAQQPGLSRMLAQLDQWHLFLRRDPATQLLESANPLEHVPSLMTAVAVAEGTVDSNLFWKAYDEGRFDELLRNPAVRRHFRAFQDDPKTRHAAKTRDLRTLVRSRQFAEALADDELCAVVAEHWPAIRAQVSAVDLQRARESISQLDGEDRAKFEHARRRAAEFGVEVPSGLTTP